MKWKTEQLAELNRLIGLPYRDGAEGPDAFYCFGLVRYVKHTFYGLEVPAMLVDANSPLQVARALRRAAFDDSLVVPTDTPKDGDGVILGQCPVFEHVGLFIDAPGARGVIHAQRSTGVIFQRASNLAWNQQSFFRFVGESPL